jgi:preprotein translocase subunit SecF
VATRLAGRQMRLRRLSFPLSAFISVATVVLFLQIGLNFGIDFKGA